MDQFCQLELPLKLDKLQTSSTTAENIKAVIKVVLSMYDAKTHELHGFFL